MKPERIAHVIGKLSAGGVEAVMYNYYRFIGHSKYQFDFIYDADSSCEPLQELIDMGARYYVVHPYQQLPQYLRDLKRIFRENHYRIVHSSMNALAVFSLYAAWREGAPVRICHSHSTAAKGETKKNILNICYALFLRHLLPIYALARNLPGNGCLERRLLMRVGLLFLITLLICLSLVINRMCGKKPGKNLVFRMTAC